MARRTKLNAKLQQKIVDTIAQGNYAETAAAHAGINESTYYDWMKRGRKEEERLEKAVKNNEPKESEAVFLEFFRAVNVALVEAETRNIGVINVVARGGVQTKSKVVTHRMPIRENGRVLRDEDGNILYSERTTEESTLAPPNWQAAAWWLEKKLPEKYGRNRVELSGPNGDPLATTQVSFADYEKMVAKRRTKVSQNMAGLTEEEL